MRVLIPLLAAVCLAAPVLAEEAAKPAPGLAPVPDVPPPGQIDPDLEPQVVIKHRGKDKVEEYRIKGRLYMIKVTPPRGRPYYLVDSRGDGQLRRYDDLSPNFMVPMWLIKTF
jgi:hypothetical protein